MKIFERKKRRSILVGGVKIGGNDPIIIQSMTKTNPLDQKATLKQIKSIKKNGGEIVRLAVPCQESAKIFANLAKVSPLPLVADIHFDFRLAIFCAQNGASKIRFNPGNIGEKENIKKLVKACLKAKIPIRIGVNCGSLEKKFSQAKAQNLVKSALSHVKILEKENFYDICLSVKSSEVRTNILANQILASKTNYPLHIGVTEAGVKEIAIIKSATCLGALLPFGIGDTIRISMTDQPEEEIKVAKEILQSLSLRKLSREFISCPGCGRVKFALQKIAQEIFQKTKNLPVNLKLAVMGCSVNGPGEAKNADYAIVGADKYLLIFKKGKIIKKTTEKNVIKEFLNLLP